MMTHQQDKPAEDIGYLCLLEELQPKLDTDDGLRERDEAAEKQGHRTVTTRTQDSDNKDTGQCQQELDMVTARPLHMVTVRPL